MTNGNTEKPLFTRIIRKIIGPPRDINDPGIFHKLALIPFFAWIGLGADGLSSSAYGPEEAFRALGEHTYLALFLAIASAATVFIISYTYSKVIEHFPHGGGGYIVASHMLGKRIGVVSGSALIVDYILTITVSITSCVDALFSYLPVQYQQFKIITAAVMIIVLDYFEHKRRQGVNYRTCSYIYYFYYNSCYYARIRNFQSCCGRCTCCEAMSGKGCLPICRQ